MYNGSRAYVWFSGFSGWTGFSGLTGFSGFFNARESSANQVIIAVFINNAIITRSINTVRSRRATRVGSGTSLVGFTSGAGNITIFIFITVVIGLTFNALLLTNSASRGASRAIIIGVTSMWEITKVEVVTLSHGSLRVSPGQETTIRVRRWSSVSTQVRVCDGIKSTKEWAVIVRGTLYATATIKFASRFTRVSTVRVLSTIVYTDTSCFITVWLITNTIQDSWVGREEVRTISTVYRVSGSADFSGGSVVLAMVAFSILTAVRLIGRTIGVVVTVRLSTDSVGFTFRVKTRANFERTIISSAVTVSASGLAVVASSIVVTVR